MRRLALPLLALLALAAPAAADELTISHSGRIQADLQLRVSHETGALIVALRKPDGSFDTTPNPDVRIDVGDTLIAIGTEPELRALEDLFAPRETVAG